MVNTSFEIRDMVRSKKDEHKFLVLVISTKKEKIYLGDCERLKPVVHNRIEHVPGNLPEPVANFTDSKTIKETSLVKFLHYIDNGFLLYLMLIPCRCS
jgi:hypothetical protein